MAFFSWNLGRYPLLASHDANRESAVHLHLLDVEEEARSAEVGRG